MVVDQFLLPSKVTIVILVLLDALSILKISSVFEVIKLALLGWFLELLIHVVLLTHRLKRLVVSSIYFFTEGPAGSINIFFWLSDPFIDIMNKSFKAWSSNFDSVKSFLVFANISFIIAIIVAIFWFDNTLLHITVSAGTKV